MRRLLPVLLLLLPVAELFLLLRVGGAVGALPTLGLLLLAAAAGVAVVRRQGRAAWGRVREAAQAGRAPGADAADGALLLLAGALLALPGFLTDVVGLALLVAPLRHRVAARVLRGVASRAAAAGTSGFGPLVVVREHGVPGSGPVPTWARAGGGPAGAPDVEGHAAPHVDPDPQTSPARDASDPRARGVLDA